MLLSGRIYLIMFKRIENYSDFPTPTQIGIFNLFLNGYSFMSFLTSRARLLTIYIYTYSINTYTHTTVYIDTVTTANCWCIALLYLIIVIIIIIIIIVVCVCVSIGYRSGCCHRRGPVKNAHIHTHTYTRAQTTRRTCIL